MKHITGVALLLLFLIGFTVALYWFLNPKPIPVDVATVEKNNFQQYLENEARTRVKSLYIISTPSQGKLKRITLKVGEWVKKDARLATVSTPRGKINITAPIHGKILKIMHQNEAVLPAGTPILQLANTQQLEVVANVLSTDAINIPRHASVILNHWGGRSILKGRVRAIEPVATIETSPLGVKEQRVNVIIDITSPFALWKKLGEGYSVDARILLLSLKNVLLIPNGALFRDGNAWATYVVRNSAAHKQIISIAQRNADYAVVTAGLQAGDEVILYPSDKITPGARIQERLPSEGKPRV